MRLPLSFRKDAIGRRVIVTVILCFCLFVVGFVVLFVFSMDSRLGHIEIVVQG